MAYRKTNAADRIYSFTRSGGGGGGGSSRNYQPLTAPASTSKLSSSSLPSSYKEAEKVNITPRANIYADAMKAAVDKLNAIEKFNYNQKEDPFYQQYAEMYQKNAKLGMENAMGQAAALTGGYGSSYAETAGQAMYNQVMSGLNDKALDLYNASLNAYNSYVDLAAQQAGVTINAYGADQDTINTELNAAQWQADFNESQRQADNSAYERRLELEQAEDQFNRNLQYNYDSLNSDMQYKYTALDQDQRQFNAQMAQSDRQFNSEQAYRYASLQQNDRQFNQQFEYQKQRDNASDEQYASDLAYKYASLNQAQAQYDSDLKYKYAALERSSQASNKSTPLYATDKSNAVEKNMLTENEFNRRNQGTGYSNYGTKSKSYKDYVENVIDNAVKKGQIDDDSAMYLYRKYGIA